ncbi:MAG: BatD family protein, partial [Gemmatimonadales bacterium]
MIALLLLGLLQDPGSLSLDLHADRDRVRLDDEILLTLRAESPSSEPIRIDLPPVNGFEIISRSERREVSPVGVTARISVLELRLRATRIGTFRVGPARATQG